MKKKLEKFIPSKCLWCGMEIHCTDKSGRRSSKRKFCSQKHFRLWNRGKNIKAWKGGRKKHGEYIQVLIGRQHLFSDVNGYIMEHRLLFERYAVKNNLIKYLVKDIETGKLYLNPHIKIHHKNHNKSDNRISNLIPVFSQKEHFHFNYCPHCPHCNKSDELLETPKRDNQQVS